MMWKFCLRVFINLLFICSSFLSSAQHNKNKEEELYRPRIHFTPTAHWMNDPNGMVYYKGTYHLFFQYYPLGSVWGPMHWGHTTSKDLIHWKEQPIALYPDSLGYIFSGSMVVDKKNTSGFGKNGQPPLVAIFTHHDPKREKGFTDFQNQSLAYSNDDGKTWIKYVGNPVLKNPGIIDFRDPKVMWYEPKQKWIMTLATKDCITFYSSPDLKNWTKESEFGKTAGAHGGVWECPDLFPLNYNGKKIWVLIVSLNPGGPNGGSATQYFLGNFNGHEFVPSHNNIKWMDYGPDDYAGVTWSNTGNRKNFLGWMSNWDYATIVPTTTWRSALTLPRDLKIVQVGKELFVASQPVPELLKIQSNPFLFNNLNVLKDLDLTKKIGQLQIPIKLYLETNELKDVAFRFSNTLGEEILIGYNKNENNFFIDRSRSGKTDFHKSFAAKHTALRLSKAQTIKMTLIIDASSVELFADDGLTVMTSVFFVNEKFTQLNLLTQEYIKIKKLEYATLKRSMPLINQTK